MSKEQTRDFREFMDHRTDVPEFFQMEMFGEFPPSNQFLEQLAIEYLNKCDSFDRAVCTKSGMPSTPSEQGQVSRHAIETVREIADRNGVPVQAIRDAIRERLRYERSK